MKKIIHAAPVLLIAAIAFFLQGCIKDTLTSTYVSFEPVYKNKSEVLQDIKSGSAQSLRQTGKMALYGNYIFLNELNKGVHVIDNSNPASPQNIAFIKIPGAIDLALKDNVLYADIYTDMVTIDISNPHNAVLKKVSHSVFPERQYSGGFMADSTKYIVDWIKHESTEKTDIETSRRNVSGGIWMEGQVFMASAFNSDASSGGIRKSSSVGGSMARFTIVDDYLYTVGSASLTSFNVSNAVDPVVASVTNFSWNIETIYPLNNKLFIGSQTGMFIFSIDDPAQPTMLSSFSHACFNDPVIANDHYAFVTLKAFGQPTPCRGTGIGQTNEMDIVDISNIMQPTLLKIYDMEEPQGLSLDGEHLFVCDGKGGLKVYDAGDVMNLMLLKTFNDINPFDVVAYNGLAIVVAKEGIIQYDYSNINNIRKLSTITLNQ